MPFFWRSFCLPLLVRDIGFLFWGCGVYRRSFSGGSSGKEPACQYRRQEKQVRSLGQKDALQEGMATHSGIPAWRIPWTVEPGGLQSMGLHRVGHD